MTEADLRDHILTAPSNIAPEADLSKLDRQRRIRDQLDNDSMDFLSFVIGLHEALHIDIPERDDSSVATLDGCIRYLSSRQST